MVARLLLEVSHSTLDVEFTADLKPSVLFLTPSNVSSVFSFNHIPNMFYNNLCVNFGYSAAICGHFHLNYALYTSEICYLIFFGNISEF